MTSRTQAAAILLTSMLATMVAIVAGRIVFGLLMPAMLPALQMDYADGGRLGAASALGYLVGIAPAGAFATRFGEKRVEAAMGAAPLAAYAAAWKDPPLRATAAIYGALGVALTAHNLFIYSHAIESGLSPSSAGALVAASGVLSIFAGPVLGYVSDRVDRLVILHASVLACACATAGVASLPTPWVFALYFAVSGLVTLGIPALVLASTAAQAQHAQLPGALATSFVTLAYALGQQLAPAVIGLVAKGDGSHLRWVFLAVAFIMAAAAVPGIRARGRSARAALQRLE